MNILITGVAGFIGSNLLDRLLKDNNFVIGIDNFLLGNHENISKNLSNKNFVFINKSIFDKNIISIIKKNLGKKNIDEIWHLAASSDILKGVKNPDFDHRNTFQTTLKVCKISQLLGVKKIIFTSTGAIYGIHKEKLNEEKTVPKPISSYGTFKLASENILRTYFNNYFDSVVIFRFSNVVGRNSTHGAIFDFINKIKKSTNSLKVLGNGNQQKPYIHIDEVIDGMLKISKKIKNKIDIVNLGPDDTGVKVSYIAEKVVEEFPQEITIMYENQVEGWVGDIPKYRFDVTKSRNYGFTTKLSSKEVINKAVSEIYSQLK